MKLVVTVKFPRRSLFKRGIHQADMACRVYGDGLKFSENSGLFSTTYTIEGDGSYVRLLAGLASSYGGIEIK